MSCSLYFSRIYTMGVDIYRNITRQTDNTTVGGWQRGRLIQTEELAKISQRRQDLGSVWRNEWDLKDCGKGHFTKRK